MGSRFKKHRPKRFDGRGPIRRKYCDACDRGKPLIWVKPDFPVELEEGYKTSFTTAVRVSDVGQGMIRLLYTVPDQRLLQIHLNPLRLNVSDGSVQTANYERRIIEPFQTAYAEPIRYCPLCGRDFKTKRPRLFSKGVHTWN